MLKRQNAERAQRQMLKDGRSEMADVFSSWSRVVVNQKAEHLAEMSLSEHAAHEEKLASAHANKVASITRQLQNQMQGGQRQCLVAWSTFVRSSAKARAAKKQNMGVGTRMATQSASALLSTVLCAWARDMNTEKQQALQRRLSEAEASQSSMAKRRREKAKQLGGNAAFGMDQALRSRCFAGWHSVAHECRLKHTSLGHSRGAGERLFALRKRVVTGRALARWQLIWMLRSATGQNSRLVSLHRVFILRTRSKLILQKFLRVWLRVLPLKPWSAPALQRVPGWMKEPSFLKDPPQIYVRPALATDRGVRSPSRRPELIISPSASACDLAYDEPSLYVGTIPCNSEAMPCSIVMDPTTSSLQPGERYVMATHAMTSDAEYKRLLEHNRREIKERRGEYEIRVAEPGEQAVQGWGIWTQ
jgi:hypothetical protein